MSSAWFKAAAVMVLAWPFTVAAAPASTRAPQMIDQTGHTFTFASLHGRPLIVTFVASRCTDACPLINARFARAQALFQQRHLDARLLTITLEPQHDTRAVMRDLAHKFNADPHRWLLATGSIGDIRAIMNAFGVHGDAGNHTTFVYLFDANGRFRERILASSVLEMQLADELRSLPHKGN